MFCSGCGAADAEKYSFCPTCGKKFSPAAAGPQTYSYASRVESTSMPSNSGNAQKQNKKIAWWAVVIIILTISAALNGQNLYQYLGSLISGQVTLSASIVEKNIQDTVKKKTGLTVSVTCPDPLQGKVGDTRQCTVDEPLGLTELVDVTIQNTNGAFTWQIHG
jgi:Domain of unknown function (DUF4333)